VTYIKNEISKFFGPKVRGQFLPKDFGSADRNSKLKITKQEPGDRS